MTRLISQYEASFGISEEDEADRLRALYGWQRACTLANVFENTCPRVYRAFWFRVQFLLAGQNDGVIPATLRKEREQPRPLPVPPKALYVDVDGVKISRADFLRFFKQRKLAKA